jgi:hypothetical protein
LLLTGDPVGAKGVHADERASDYHRICRQSIKRRSVVFFSKIGMPVPPCYEGKGPDAF